MYSGTLKPRKVSASLAFVTLVEADHASVSACPIRCNLPEAAFASTSILLRLLGLQAYTNLSFGLSRYTHWTCYMKHGTRY